MKEMQTVLKVLLIQGTSTINAKILAKLEIPNTLRYANNVPHSSINNNLAYHEV